MSMRRKRNFDEGEDVGAIIREMGRERMALRARKTTVVILLVCSLLCLSSALASLTGFIPYAVGPAMVLLAASAVGFILAAIEARGA